MLTDMAPVWRDAKALALQAGRFALDVIAPPTCPLTGSPVDAPGRIAPDAWSRLRFLSAPWCAICGFPFEFDPGSGALCAPCAAHAPTFDRARAALAYDEASKALILDFKHAGRREALKTFAAWLTSAGAEVLSEDSVLAPTPLHADRLRRRRFNQAALLARAVSQRTGLRFDPDLIQRSRNTPTQAGLSARGRLRNVAGAFALRPGAEARVVGADIVLVDDVYTTGATLDACARVLKRAGAARVCALTVMRVVKPTDALI